jgi:nucleoside-diphosphate-sugar epimerase
MPEEEGEPVSGEKIRYIRGDLRDMGKWTRALQGVDAVISMSKPFAESEKINDEREIDDYAKKHTLEVTNLLKAAGDAGVKMAVTTYDVLCMGDRGDKEITDVTDVKPVGYCRVLEDSIEPVKDVCEQFDMELVSVLPAFVYGDGSWFARLVDDIQNGKAKIVEPGDNYMSFLHIEDLAWMYVDIVDNIETTDTLILADQMPVKQRDFIGKICQLTGMQVPETVSLDEYVKLFGRLNAEAFSTSIRVNGERALDRLDHELEFPTIDEGLVDVLEGMGFEIRRERFRRAA